MKYITLSFAILFLSSCATTYDTATRSLYVGNGVHEIRSSGNAYTSSDAIRNYMFKKAYETCAAEGKGFVIQGQQDTSSKKVIGDANGITTYHFPGGRMLIKCDGEIDRRLASQFESTD